MPHRTRPPFYDPFRQLLVPREITYEMACHDVAPVHLSSRRFGYREVLARRQIIGSKDIMAPEARTVLNPDRVEEYVSLSLRVQLSADSVDPRRYPSPQRAPFESANYRLDAPC